MKWFKRQKPTDPGADYIAQLNAEAEERANQPVPYLRAYYPPSIHKPMIYFQPSPPTRQPLETGDMWVTDSATKRWNGLDWELVQLSPNQITASHITASQIKANPW